MAQDVPPTEWQDAVQPQTDSLYNSLEFAMQAKRNRLLNDDPTTCDLVRVLAASKTDAELQELVARINAEAKVFHASEFHLSCDATVFSRDFRKRVSLTTN